jgi:hypothetical protein
MINYKDSKVNYPVSSHVCSREQHIEKKAFKFVILPQKEEQNADSCFQPKICKGQRSMRCSVQLNNSNTRISKEQQRSE